MGDDNKDHQQCSWHLAIFTKILKYFCANSLMSPRSIYFSARRAYHRLAPLPWKGCSWHYISRSSSHLGSGVSASLWSQIHRLHRHNYQTLQKGYLHLSAFPGDQWEGYQLAQCFLSPVLPNLEQGAQLPRMTSTLPSSWFGVLRCRSFLQSQKVNSAQDGSASSRCFMSFYSHHQRK